MAFVIDKDAFYTPGEYCKFSGTEESTEAKKRSQGTGCLFVKHGKNVFYRGSDILAHLQERTVSHGAEYRDRFEQSGKAAA